MCSGAGTTGPNPFSPPRTPPLFPIALTFRGKKRTSQEALKGERSRYREAGTGQTFPPLHPCLCCRNLRGIHFSRAAAVVRLGNLLEARQLFSLWDSGIQFEDVRELHPTKAHRINFSEVRMSEVWKFCVEAMNFTWPLICPP